MVSGLRRPTNRKIRSRSLIAMASCLGFLCGWGPRTIDQDSFEFRKGARWVYEGRDNGKKKTVIQEVIRVAREPRAFSREPATIFRLATRGLNEETGGMELESTKAYLGVDGGYFISSSGTGPPLRIFKLASEKGDAWPCLDPVAYGTSGARFVHLGEEEITVPAGTFRRARHVRLEIDSGGRRYTGDLHVVPGIGVVRSSTASEGNDGATYTYLELRRFSPHQEY